MFRYSQTALRLQYGIKFAVAGILTLYAARWLRLESTNWAMTTVAVLMVAQYVGAMVEKAFFRILGTIVGALLGVALVGNFLGNGPLFLTLLFILVTFFNYMVGGKRASYAFLLCSMTMLIVIGGSMFSPEKAWDVALSRTLDIGLGIVVTLIVSTVLWPRHARQHFQHLATDMLRHLEVDAHAAERALHSHVTESAELAKLDAEHFRNIDLLRKLLLFGTRESAAFAARVPSYQIIVDRLDRMHMIFMGLARAGKSKSLFISETMEEFSVLLTAMKKECGIFRESFTEQLPPKNGNLKLAQKAFMERLEMLRSSGALHKKETAEFASFAGFATGFLEATALLQTIREELKLLFAKSYQAIASEKRESWFAIDPAHMILAFKGSITAVIAVVFSNWLHPPGADSIPIVSWLFIMLPKGYFYGKQGQKSIYYAFLAVVIGIPSLVLFTFLAPVMAYYAFANIFLFIAFFLLGWAYFERVGVFSQILYALVLAITGAVSLCQDWPIPSGGFQNWYFTIIISFIICALVQRLIWPPLPQNEFFGACRQYFSECLSLLDPDSKKPMDSSSAQVFQIVSNAGLWVDSLPMCPPEERDRLHQFLFQMRAVGYQLTMLKDLGDKNQASHGFLTNLQPFLTPLRETLLKNLTECYRAFERRCTPAPPSPSQANPTEEFSGLYKKLNYAAIHQIGSTPILMEILNTLFRLEAAASAAWNCRQLVSGLHLENYAGDVAI